MTKKYEFVTCKCKKIEFTGDSWKTYIGRDCKCSRAKDKEKIEYFESKEGIISTLL